MRGTQADEDMSTKKCLPGLHESDPRLNGRVRSPYSAVLAKLVHILQDAGLRFFIGDGSLVFALRHGRHDAACSIYHGLCHGIPFGTGEPAFDLGNDGGVCLGKTGKPKDSLHDLDVYVEIEDPSSQEQVMHRIGLALEARGFLIKMGLKEDQEIFALHPGIALPFMNWSPPKAGFSDDQVRNHINIDLTFYQKNSTHAFWPWFEGSGVGGRASEPQWATAASKGPGAVRGAWG